MAWSIKGYQWLWYARRLDSSPKLTSLLEFFF